MQVTVSLTVEVDASAGINALEEQVVEQGRTVMQQLLAHGLQQYEAEHAACPQCGSPRAQPGEPTARAADALRARGGAAAAAPVSRLRGALLASGGLLARVGRGPCDRGAGAGVCAGGDLLALLGRRRGWYATSAEHK
jgi:hypothetical protein